MDEDGGRPGGDDGEHHHVVDQLATEVTSVLLQPVSAPVGAPGQPQADDDLHGDDGHPAASDRREQERLEGRQVLDIAAAAGVRQHVEDREAVPEEDDDGDDAECGLDLGLDRLAPGVRCGVHESLQGNRGIGCANTMIIA